MIVHEVGGCTIVQGDCLEILRLLSDRSIQCCVTSPPYWGLRDYGTAKWEGGDPDHKHDRVVARNGRGGSSAPEKQTANAFPSDLPAEVCSCGAVRKDVQLGLESTPEEYVAKMVVVLREARRVLRDDGTLWLNLGDSYNSPPAGNKTPSGFSQIGGKRDGNLAQYNTQPKQSGLKPKDLVGIPWRVAFALQADGWYLRQDIIWAKPNPMPESVRDRCTKSHEYIFLLTKNERYYFDAEAIKEPVACDEATQRRKNKTRHEQRGKGDQEGIYHARGEAKPFSNWSSTRNKRSVWIVTTKPFKGAHFATFPSDLIEPCILAGTSAKGACPNCGAGWKRVVEKGAPDLEHQIACGSDANGEYSGESTKDYATAGAQDASATKARILAGMVAKVTTGCVPSCGCYGTQEFPEYPNSPKAKAPEEEWLEWRTACGIIYTERQRLLALWEPLPVVPCFILDPFAGAGTVGLMANKHGRKSLLLELNPEYCQIAANRLAGVR